MIWDRAMSMPCDKRNVCPDDANPVIGLDSTLPDVINDYAYGSYDAVIPGPGWGPDPDCQSFSGLASCVEVVVLTSSIILEDDSGNFWALFVDTDGNLYTDRSSGPATNPVILDDGAGGFWQVVVDVSGLRGAESVSGPASTNNFLDDINGHTWTLVVDPVGNLGAQY